MTHFWQAVGRMVPPEYVRCKMTLDNTTSKSRWRVTIYPQGPINP